MKGGQIVMWISSEMENDIAAHRSKTVSDMGGHLVDHNALWEALIFLSRKVRWLEDQIDGGDE